MKHVCLHILPKSTMSALHLYTTELGCIQGISVRNGKKQGKRIIMIQHSLRLRKHRVNVWYLSTSRYMRAVFLLKDL